MTTTLELGPAALDLLVSPGDFTLNVEFPDDFPMTGTWTLVVRDRITSIDTALDITMTVDDHTLTHAFDLQGLLDLIPHTGDDTERVYSGEFYRGSWVLSQDETPRIAGAFTVSLTPLHETGS